jgi:hypothetical protein
VIFLWVEAGRRGSILSEAGAAAGFLKQLLGSDFLNRFKARPGEGRQLRRLS